MYLQKPLFNNLAYESSGVSPLSLQFCCCFAPLVGVLNFKNYAKQQRKKTKNHQKAP